ncbi:hypothetical protein ACWC5I_25735 [Kitasatospora sp. NPDC001574]
MARCLACTHRDTPGRLCDPCTACLGEQLLDLPHLVADLNDCLAPSTQTPDRLGTRHTAAAHPPLPVVENVLDLLGPGGIITTLETWRRLLATDTGESTADPWGDLPGRLRRAVTALHRRLPFIRLDWARAGDLVHDIARLHRTATHHTAPTGPPPTLLGHHPADRAGDDPCGGRLELPHAGKLVRCARCGAAWGPLHWLRLRRTIEAARVTNTAA